ncbi:hypothetical protein GCM10017673_13120 [Streptosporangium violaceochromogenes]|nr:hypothetical protein GCM10017673_13120 [Streptosporangium violaceochromogenes]
MGDAGRVSGRPAGHRAEARSPGEPDAFRAERPAGEPARKVRGPAVSAGGEKDDEPLKVAVVDVHRLIWSALTMVLRQAGQRIVAVAASVDELADTPEPDVVVCDLHLPEGPSGAQAVERLAGNGRRVLAMSGSADPETVLDAVEAGATGFVEKSEDPSSFAAAVEAVGRDGVHVSARLAGYLLEDLRRRPLAANDLGARHVRALRALARGDTVEDVGRDLTLSRSGVVDLLAAALEAARRRRRRYRPSPREREVMTLLACEGLARGEIAERLGVAPWTVTSVLENLRSKYVRLHPDVAPGIRPSAAALLWAMQLRLCEQGRGGRRAP